MRLCRWGAGLAHVGKNLIDGVRVGDICDDSQCATTQGAHGDVELERAFESLLPMLTPDWSERQIAHELEAKMRFLGAEGCSFAPIVAAGATA